MKDTYTKYAVLTAFLVLITLALIRILDLSYPISVVNTNRSAELSVVGEGKVDVVPDTAYVEVGVTVNNTQTVDQAQNEIDGTNKKIIDSMQKLQIPKQDIKTSNYSIYPNYSYEGNQNKITGYNGNVTITIKVKDTNTVQRVIEEASKAGANQIQGARFSVENPDKYREEARNKAIDNAKSQAEKLSKNLGIKLGRVVNIIENSSNGGPMPYYDKAMAIPEANGRGGGPVIEAGTQTVSSVVTLYFEKK